MDEDDAILAFSNTMPGNDDAPVTVQVDEKAMHAEKKAKKELDNLSDNDATSAFAALEQAQEI
jgi:hypothetical protein